MKGKIHIRSIFAGIILCSIAMSLLLSSSFSARSMENEEMTVYSRHENTSNRIAVTFDDGPSEKYTPEILDILSQYGVRATFFVIGEYAEKHPELVKREIDSGHEVGNHTYSHINLVRAGRDAAMSELKRTQEIIYESDEYRCSLIRPPEGKYTAELLGEACELDCRIVLWTVDTVDWRHTPPDDIYENITKNVKSGDIILFHDGIVGESPTPEALRMVIPELQRRGFELVTVSDLLRSS